MTTLVQPNFLTVNRELTNVSKFLTTTAVHCQRQEEPRHKQVMKFLNEKTLPTHLEVATVTVFFTDDYYQFGESYSINGNTRKYIWNKYPNFIPTDKIYVTNYFATNRKEVEEIYRSIDSRNSVETVNQLMTGHFRGDEFKPLSKKLKAGNFGTALGHAYACCHSKKYSGPDNCSLDLTNQKEYNFFKNEIKFLDSY